MYSSRTQPIARRSGALLGQVLGLLAFSMLFTAAGALIGPRLGGAALPISALGSIVTLLVLIYARRLGAAVRLGLFYLFSTLEGLLLGVVLHEFYAAGLGNVVVLAAGTTAGLVLALGTYGWTTRRDLSGMGGYLFTGLVGVLIASVIGIFVSAPIFHLAIAGVTAILFAGYILYDVQQVQHAKEDADPILLAIDLYLDVLNLFLAILRILAYVMSDDD